MSNSSQAVIDAAKMGQETESVVARLNTPLGPGVRDTQTLRYRRHPPPSSLSRSGTWQPRCGLVPWGQ
jgi:hypothetical protein